MPNEIDPGEVILEFVQIGALVRVSAMEPNSLTEVVIYGPASAGEAALRRTVLCKLDYAVARAADAEHPAPRVSSATVPRRATACVAAVPAATDGRTGLSKPSGRSSS
jgi:hypothetical protein